MDSFLLGRPSYCHTRHGVDVGCSLCYPRLFHHKAVGSYPMYGPLKCWAGPICLQ
ncbi:hypothetical protein LguiB_001944 [Lonicera macranthoides]